MHLETTIAAWPSPQAQQEYWELVNPILVLVSCHFECILRVVGSCGAVVDVVEPALLSPVAASELRASVSDEVNWHAK